MIQKDRVDDVNGWATVERRARYAAIALIVITGVFLAGQMTAASAISNALIEGRLDAWASGDQVKTQALANLRQCERAGPAITEAGCIAQAAPGALGIDLANEMHRALESSARATPAPLRWFLG